MYCHQFQYPHILADSLCQRIRTSDPKGRRFQQSHVSARQDSVRRGLVRDCLVTMYSTLTLLSGIPFHRLDHSAACRCLWRHCLRTSSTIGMRSPSMNVVLSSWQNTWMTKSNQRLQANNRSQMSRKSGSLGLTATCMFSYLASVMVSLDLSHHSQWRR